LNTVTGNTNMKTNKNNTNTPTEDSILEGLLAIPTNQVGAPVIKAALEKLRAEQEAKQLSNAIEQIKFIETTIAGQVDYLRSLRKIEQRQRKMVLELDKAKKEFLATGDFNAFGVTRRNLFAELNIHQ
jgi:hypothetical protein